MKSYTGIVIISIGIISFIITQIVNDRFSYFSMHAIGIIIVGIVWIIFNSTDSKQKYNYRETDSENNCMKCKYSDIKYFNELYANCKFLHIRVDKFHI
ncbi:hypothetical protein Metbo_0649 [Methanobacterium lacus]|uniref:Uncharacterized protein n=1 Tax=Methanobacterium lacus (strain AL-21) TaxID=877455 RepID=F0TAE8_METLA|nr:hypothetical protein [Methanobacterium lacus]ADZ08900.1 hypothetical protein Metbo_0649 [Methanobacterium lacus]